MASTLRGLAASLKINQDEATQAGLAIGEKTRMINDYKAATSQKSESSVPKPSAPARVDKINPKGKYGDKPGEERIDTSEMTKPLGSYKKGTSKVPKTGPYKLHEGEAVATKKQASKLRKKGGLARVLSGK